MASELLALVFIFGNLEIVDSAKIVVRPESQRPPQQNVWITKNLNDLRKLFVKRAALRAMDGTREPIGTYSRRPRDYEQLSESVSGIEGPIAGVARAPTALRCFWESGRFKNQSGIEGPIAGVA